MSADDRQWRKAAVWFGLTMTVLAGLFLFMAVVTHDKAIEFNVSTELPGDF